MRISSVCMVYYFQAEPYQRCGYANDAMHITAPLIRKPLENSHFFNNIFPVCCLQWTEMSQRFGYFTINYYILYVSFDCSYQLTLAIYIEYR